jgi:hypothetical protein
MVESISHLQLKGSINYRAGKKSAGDVYGILKMHRSGFKIIIN